MIRFGKIGKNVHFWVKMTIFGSKLPFLGQNGQLLTIFDPKNQNNPMNGFSDLERTEERKNGRTNESETIDPQRRWRGTNKRAML